MNAENPWSDTYPREMTGLVAGGFIERLLLRVGTSRKIKWASYYRACRHIPKDSPVYGATSWKRINERRGDLITREILADVKARGGKPFRRFTRSAELEALQKVCGELAPNGIVVQNFLLGRMLRRLKAKHPETLKDL